MSNSLLSLLLPCEYLELLTSCSERRRHSPYHHESTDTFHVDQHERGIIHGDISINLDKILISHCMFCLRMSNTSWEMASSINTSSIYKLANIRTEWDHMLSNIALQWMFVLVWLANIRFFLEKVHSVLLRTLQENERYNKWFKHGWMPSIYGRCVPIRWSVFFNQRRIGLLTSFPSTSFSETTCVYFFGEGLKLFCMKHLSIPKQTFNNCLYCFGYSSKPTFIPPRSPIYDPMVFLIHRLQWLKLSNFLKCLHISYTS